MPVPDSRRWLFPNDRSAYVRQGPMRAVLQPPVMNVVVYTDQAATALANIVTPEDQPIEDSELVIDEDGLLPEFYGPITVNKLWLRPVGSTEPPAPIYPVYVPIPIETGTGAPGGAVFFQDTPAAIWGPIPHNFGYRPTVDLFSTDYTTHYDGFQVTHLSENSLRISMDVPISGLARLS